MAVESKWGDSIYSLIGRKSVFAMRGEEHTKMRRILNSVFSETAVYKALPGFIETLFRRCSACSSPSVRQSRKDAVRAHHAATDVTAPLCRYTDDWKRKSATGEPIPVFTEAGRMASDLAVCVVLGDLLEEEELSELHRQFSMFAQGLFLPSFGFPEGIPGTPHYKAHKVRKFACHRQGRCQSRAPGQHDHRCIRASLKLVAARSGTQEDGGDGFGLLPKHVPATRGGRGDPPPEHAAPAN